MGVRVIDPAHHCYRSAVKRGMLGAVCMRVVRGLSRQTAPIHGRAASYLVARVHVDGHVSARTFKEVQNPVRLLPDCGRGDPDDNDDRASAEAEAALLKARPDICDLHPPAHMRSQRNGRSVLVSTN